MKQFKYNVGDHVVIERTNIGKHAGETGVIRECKQWVDGYKYEYRVVPDSWDHANEPWYGIWSVVKGYANTEKIVITTDGKTTTATLYENDKKVKSASTKCSPDDKFDFAIGAKIAMDRLYPEKSEPKEEVVPKYLNCKFVFTKCEGRPATFVTIGKIYEVVNGRFVNDIGHHWPWGGHLEDEADLRMYVNGNERNRIKGKEFMCGGKYDICIIEE